MYNVCNWVTQHLEESYLSDPRIRFSAAQAIQEGLIPEPLQSRFAENGDTPMVEFGVHPTSRKPVPVSMLETAIINLKWIGTHHKQLGGTQFAEVMTTAHFTNYFSDALSREFRKQYQYKTGEWQKFVFMDRTPDFRDVKRFRMEKRQNMQKRREKAPRPATNLVLSTVQYGVEEYSEVFDVSWRAIMNDDLGAIRQTPSMMVQTTREWLDEFVSALYDNATTQATLVALGALYAGTGRLTEANLAIGLNAMFQRTDSTGRQMNIDKVWLVVPKVSEIAARKILETTIQYIPGSGNAGKNVVPEYITGIAIDPYMSFSGADVPWYLVADPQVTGIPAVTLARLQGWDGPVVFMKKGNIEPVTGAPPAPFLMGDFDYGDIVYGVEDVVGGWDDSSYVGVTDFRGIYFSSGTTP